MKNIMTTRTGALILTALLLAGCGSASAPPVDLPAPITGRIDVSSPDENGDVTVTGSEGSVTGGATVLVVNETEAGTVSQIILDLLIPNAYAQTYPAICEEVGHACTQAGDDGSFQLTIAASVDDSLAIGLIDSEGEWISDVIRIAVPESGTPDPAANCAGEGVFGEAVDVAIAPTSGTPVMLRKGSTTTTNQLVIGTSTPTTVSISGCHAHSLAFFESSLGDSIAVTSKDDMILWAGRFVGGTVTDAKSFTLDYEPMHIKFVNLSTQPIVAIRKTSNTVRLANVSTVEGTISNEMTIPTSSGAEITGLTRSTVLDVMPMTSNQVHYFGLLVTDTGSGSNSYVTVFQADGPLEKDTWSRSLLSSILPINDISDGVIFITSYGELGITLGFVDRFNNANITYRVMQAGSVLLLTDDISTTTIEEPQAGFSVTLTGGGTLENMARGTLTSEGTVGLFTDSDGNLFERSLWIDYDFSDAIAWSTGSDIVAIDTMPTGNLLYGADGTANDIIDGSSLINW